jgi:hypothetical protein
MNLNPAAVLNPVFNFLDALISDYGVYLYLVFVWMSLGAIAWVLSGGLRRRQMKGNSVTVIPAIIVTMQAPRQSAPPIIDLEAEQTWSNDGETMDQP